MWWPPPSTLWGMLLVSCWLVCTVRSSRGGTVISEDDTCAYLFPCWLALTPLSPHRHLWQSTPQCDWLSSFSFFFIPHEINYFYFWTSSYLLLFVGLKTGSNQLRASNYELSIKSWSLRKWVVLPVNRQTHTAISYMSHWHAPDVFSIRKRYLK